MLYWALLSPSSFIKANETGSPLMGYFYDIKIQKICKNCFNNRLKCNLSVKIQKNSFRFLNEIIFVIIIFVIIQACTIYGAPYPRVAISSWASLNLQILVF